MCLFLSVNKRRPLHVNNITKLSTELHAQMENALPRLSLFSSNKGRIIPRNFQK